MTVTFGSGILAYVIFLFASNIVAVLLLATTVTMTTTTTTTTTCKLALLVYKVLHDVTAVYLVDDCQLVSHAGCRWLRSADIDTCCVARTNTWFSDPSFAAAGPRLWNSLPARIC